MAVYVDPLFNCRPFAKPGTLFHRVGQSCHMYADSDEELHALARKIGLKPEWHQPFPQHRLSHYDLTPPKRRMAVRSGAIEVPAGHKPGDPLPVPPSDLFSKLEPRPRADGCFAEEYGW